MERSLLADDQLITFHKRSVTICFADYYKNVLRKRKVKAYMKLMVSLTISGVMYHSSAGRFFLMAYALDITSDSA